MLNFLRAVAFLSVCCSFPSLSDQTCPRGYGIASGESCYTFSHDSESWTGALISCQLLDGYLVEIDTLNELTFLRNMLITMKNESRWIGISNKRVQSEWEWATSRNVFDKNSFPLWSPGEPDYHGGDLDESCGLLDYIERLGHVYTLADVECSRLQKYICESSPLPEVGLEIMGRR